MTEKEKRILRFYTGYLSGAVLELHDVTIPTLADVLEEFIKKYERDLEPAVEVTT